MKDIEGYESQYAVTEEGQVWSYKTKKFLKPVTKKDGYLQVSLFKNGKAKTYLVHRLMAQTYLSNPNNLPEVHHIDGNSTNNNIKNLQWISKEDNLIDMYIRQLKKLGVSIDEIKRRYEND